MKATEQHVVQLLARVVERNFAARCEPGKTFPWLSPALPWPAHSPLARMRRELLGATKPAARAQAIVVSAYFGAPLNLIFEFDDSRHFNRWRARSLELYPADAPLSFSVRSYEELCRDARPGCVAAAKQKQQAFHDALVDLLPPAHGLNPTLRISQAELVDNPRQELRESELEKRLAKLLDERVALRANTTFLQMLRHPSAKPWVPTLFASGEKHED